MHVQYVAIKCGGVTSETGAVGYLDGILDVMLGNLVEWNLLWATCRSGEFLPWVTVGIDAHVSP